MSDEPNTGNPKRMPAEVFHPSEFIRDEMDARGWTRDDLALRMGGDFAINRVGLELYFEAGPTEPDLLIGDGKDFARAFGVSAEFFLNLERAWRKAFMSEKPSHVDVDFGAMSDDPNTTDREIYRLITYWREFQNMVAASPMWLPEAMRKAQAESWARANVAIGDPRFD
jgi:plasmid maintenance system antidote protein VapI